MLRAYLLRLGLVFKSGHSHPGSLDLLEVDFTLCRSSHNSDYADNDTWEHEGCNQQNFRFFLDNKSGSGVSLINEGAVVHQNMAIGKSTQTIPSSQTK